MFATPFSTQLHQAPTQKLHSHHIAEVRPFWVYNLGHSCCYVSTGRPVVIGSAKHWASDLIYIIPFSYHEHISLSLTETKQWWHLIQKIIYFTHINIYINPLRMDIGSSGTTRTGLPSSYKGTHMIQQSLSRQTIVFSLEYNCTFAHLIFHNITSRFCRVKQVFTVFQIGNFLSP